MTKNLFSNCTPFEKCYLVENIKQLSFINLRMAHVKSIFKAFLPCLGQHRIAAFRMLKEKYPDSKAALPVMVVNVDESALCLISVKLNTKVVFRRGGILPRMG